MFQTNVGPIEDTGTKAFLPEEDKGIRQLSVGFRNDAVEGTIWHCSNRKAFRNEIIARNFIFHQGFEQMEMQYCKTAQMIQS